MKFYFIQIGILVSSLIIPKIFLAQENYSFYHQQINEAETLFFLNNNPDSSLLLYDETFRAFEFIFLRDIVNAMQIAVYTDREFEKYICLGFKFGLKMSHLKQLPLLKNKYADFEKDQNLLDVFQKNRASYLSTINFTYLNEIYDLALRDQIDKRQERAKYEIDLAHTMRTLLQKTKKYGFPGTKYLGIADSEIFKSIGHPNRDLEKKKERYGGRLDYYTADEDLLGSKYALVILVHDQCSFTEWEEVFKLAIEKGEIHPREVGLLYDNRYRTINSKPNQCLPKKAKTYPTFYLNPFTDYSSLNTNAETVDELRNSWNIVSMKVDQAKKRFETEQGFKLTWGFWGSL